MPRSKARTNINCPECKKTFSLQNSELKRRLKKSKTGRIFCSKICYRSFERNNSKVLL